MSNKQKFIAMVNAQISFVEGKLSGHRTKGIALNVIDSALRIESEKLPSCQKELKKLANGFVFDLYGKHVPFAFGFI